MVGALELKVALPLVRSEQPMGALRCEISTNERYELQMPQVEAHPVHWLEFSN